MLAEAGGEHIKIISKIESWHGLINYDEILKESDGIMIARGDLAMEVSHDEALNVCKASGISITHQSRNLF